MQKAVVAAFNQEKALVGVFPVITNLRMDLFEALVSVRAASSAASRPAWTRAWRWTSPTPPPPSPSSPARAGPATARPAAWASSPAPGVAPGEID